MFPISQCAIGQSYKLASHRLLFRSQHKLLTSKGMEWQLLAILFWRFTFKWTNVPSSLASFSYGCLFVSRKSTFCPRKNKQTKKTCYIVYQKAWEERKGSSHVKLRNVLIRQRLLFKFWHQSQRTWEPSWWFIVIGCSGTVFSSFCWS